jgi:hypothetical protein
MDGPTLLGWARRAETRRRSSLASIGRVAWPGYDELAAFAALAYYAFIAERAEWVAKSAARSADEVRARIEAFRELGADELIFSHSVHEVDQVDLLADAAGLTV